MTDLIPRTTITEVVAHRDAAIDTMRRAVDLMAEARRLADEADRHAQLAHGAATFTLHDRSRSDAYRRLFEDIDAEASLATFRQQVDARVWVNLLALTGVGTLMDRTEKEKLDQQLAEDAVPVTEDNVWSTLEGWVQNGGLMFRRGLAKAFSALDRRFKSHDGFKIGGRIVLTHVFDCWGSWSYGNRMRDVIIDVERVFLVLDKDKPAPEVGEDGKPIPRPGLLDLIDADRGRGFNARQSLTESPYFRIRTFKNGNAHLWFTRDDLVEQANRVLADYYGAVLPDSVPADVTAEDIRRRSTALCRDLAFYPTPSAVVDRHLLQNICIDETSRVLEPSAGDGAIVRVLLSHRARVDAVEVDPGRVAQLRLIERTNPRLTVQHANFLQTAARPVYTHVVMNPPFNGTHYMQHVMHAFDFLAPGGTLVAVLPATVEFGESRAHDAFRAWMDARKGSAWRLTYHDLPEETFAASGTRINTCYVILGRDRK